MAEQFHRVMPEADLSSLAAVAVTVRDWPVVLCREGDKVFALIDRCTHAFAPLAGARLRRGSIMCPLHGARYDLASGNCLGGPYKPLRVFPVRIAEGWIDVMVPDEPPDFT